MLKPIHKAAGALGTFADVDLAACLNDNTLVQELEAALYEHEVLFFRRQRLTPPEFAKLASGLGSIETHPAYITLSDCPDVQILESTPENPSKIEVWHSDMTFRQQPPSITLLYGKTIPAYGGDTLWTSAAMAYQTLSKPMQRLLDGLEAEHDFAYGFRESLEEPGGLDRLGEAVKDNPAVTHPVIRTHPRSGKKALYVNPLFTKCLKGLSGPESDALLGLLFDHLTAIEHTVRLNWEPDTIAIWDNRTTQHRPVNDFLPQSRVMHRVTVAGEVPE